MSSTDQLLLNKKRLFQSLRDDLPDERKCTQDILEIGDDILYVWNAKKCCVLTMNIAVARTKNTEDIPFQTLLLTKSPFFEVTNLLLNQTMTHLVLWGSLEIVVMALPKRYGKDATFQGGKPEIICGSHLIDKCAVSAEIRKVRWHPASANDTHLLVLTSDNKFQLFECEVNAEPRFVTSWNVGPSPHSGSPGKIPDFTSLGETAVDFDFATPTLRRPELFADRDVKDIKSVDWRQIEWPILVLRGNGEILIVRGDILHESYANPIVMGSLSMYPPSIDNYGIDSCSILCIQTTPPIVVIAMCTGKIYHAVLLNEYLDNDVDERKTWSQYGSNYSLHTPEDALYVYECIEMELGLFFTVDDKKYNCPIHLHHDKGNKSRYFCSHNAGIHMVTLPMVSQLDKYINEPEGDNSRLPSLMNQSNPQYLICTRTKHTSPTENTSILGLGFLQDPCVLIALLHNGTVVDKSIVDLCYLPKIDPPEPFARSTNKADNNTFETYVHNLLQHETTQPITKLGTRSNVPSVECLEHLYHATHIFRTEHFARIDKVRQEISKKVRTLQTTKIHLLKDINALLEAKKVLQPTAERLAERYEDIKDKQDELLRRSGDIVKLVNYKEPSMTAMERADAEKLKIIRDKIRDLDMSLKQLKRRSTQQSNQLEHYNVNQKKQTIVFSSAQEHVIKDNLTKITNEIKDLVASVRKLENEIECREGTII